MIWVFKSVPFDRKSQLSLHVHVQTVLNKYCNYEYALLIKLCISIKSYTDNYMFKLFWYWSGVPRHWFALPDHQVWLFVPLWSGELCVFVLHEDIHQHHLLLHLELHHTRNSGSHSQRPGQKPSINQSIKGWKFLKAKQSQLWLNMYIEHFHEIIDCIFGYFLIIYFSQFLLLKTW